MVKIDREFNKAELELNFLWVLKILLRFHPIQNMISSELF